MIFIDKMKDLKIYKTKTFLPTTDGNKKKGSAVILLTPSPDSSNKLMNHPLFVNKKRYESYYIERDVSYYINSKVIDEATSLDEEVFIYNEMTAAERNALPDSAFGVPSKRKFPLDTEAHVRSAIKFFNYVDPEDEETLARNIIRAMKKFGITDVKVSDKNRFSKYYHPVKEALDMRIIEESYFINKEDFKYNVKEFNDWDINLIFITGFTGNGKTKTAMHYAKEPDTQLYELDDLINCNMFTKIEQVKKYGEVFYDYFTTDPDGKNIWNNRNKDPKDSDKFIQKATISFVKFIMDYADHHKKKRFVVEGANLYKLIHPKYLQDYAVIVKGTNGFKSAYSTARDYNNGGNLGKTLADFTYDDKSYNSNQDYLDQYIAWLIAYKERNKVAELNSESTKYDINSSVLVNEITNSINTGDKLILFGEDANNDARLKQLLFKDRIKTRKDVLALYDTMKKYNPWIKYAYPELANRYSTKNIFIDTYYYNSLFFENNTWVLQKGLRLATDFLGRIVNDPKIKAAGYTKETIFIPIIDWDKNKTGQVWNYRQSINPISCIHQMMYTSQLNNLIKIFGNKDVIFIGKDKYFKLNFSSIDVKDIKKIADKFRLFTMKICKGEEFEAEDVDTSVDNVDSPEVIQTKIADKIEDAKGVDITPNLAKANKKKKVIAAAINNVDKATSVRDASSRLAKANKDINKAKDDINKKSSDEEKKEEESKAKETTNANLNKDSKTANTNKNEENKDKLADAIVDATAKSNTEDDVLDDIDTSEIKSILMDLDIEDDDGRTDVSAGRTERIAKLDQKLLDTDIKGKSVKEILDDTSNKEVESTDIPVSGPNKDEWKNMTYMNFDKNYNIDKDIISCFRKFEHVSFPISIRKLTVTNDSTSEDRTELYHVEMEDFRGKRFTINLDIPIMVDNRFLLRGNNKSIQTQFFNMPIIKTNLEECQLISNYMKIFLRVFRSGNGRSLPIVARTIKALNKYKGSKIKITIGDNKKICAKYDLPMDYIDLAGSFSKIETDTWIYLFNQDEIREKYDVDESQGVPVAYNKKERKLAYLTGDNEFVYTFVEDLSEIKEFDDLFRSASRPSVCSYSRASIMDSQIPVVVICAYHVGLRDTMDRASIKYQIVKSLTKEIREDNTLDWIKWNDGYLVYTATYEASMLMNGLKDCPTDDYPIDEMDNKNTYIEFLDLFGGRFKSDGLDNFRDLFVDPMIEEELKHYNMPTDYINILIYGSNLLCDNRYFKHTDMSTRRFRRYQLIAVYAYKALADAYAGYANYLRHSGNPEFSVKKTAVIDAFLTDKITSDDSVINALRDLETTNAVTAKGPSGMNTARAYDLDKRGYDDSMLNVLGMSTGFAGNVGLTRQATLDSNVTPEGYVKSIDGDTSKMNTAKTLTATEALTPFGSTHDDPMRSAMTFIQTAKHEVVTVDSDPLLVTNGADEALPYMTTDRFAYKAKDDGKIIELTDDYMIVGYKSGKKEMINLKEQIEKNSDGGYFVPLKLTATKGLKVGGNIRKNQIIAYDTQSFSNSVGETDNIAYNIGKLAKVAIINSDEGYEDAGIISNAMAKKLATRIDYQYSVILDKDTDVFEYHHVGEHVEANHNLLTWESAVDDEDTQEMLRSLNKNYDVSTLTDLGKRTLKSEVTGTISSIKIYRTCEISELSPSLKKIVTEYEKPINEMAKKMKDNGMDVSQLPPHGVLPPTGKLKKAEDAILIEFYVEYRDTVGIGDKVVYFSANKATEKGIFPEGKEPYTKFRPNEKIDAFVAETSIDKRLVTSTLIIGSINKLLIELDRSVKDILGIKYDDTTV